MFVDGSQIIYVNGSYRNNGAVKLKKCLHIFINCITILVLLVCNIVLLE